MREETKAVRRSESPTVSDVFFRIICLALGLAVWIGLAFIMPWSWDQKFGWGLLAGLATASLTYLIICRFDDARKARKLEARKHNKLIELGLYNMAFGAFGISIIALIVSILAYLK